KRREQRQIARPLAGLGCSFSSFKLGMTEITLRLGGDRHDKRCRIAVRRYEINAFDRHFRPWINPSHSKELCGFFSFPDAFIWLCPRHDQTLLWVFDRFSPVRNLLSGDQWTLFALAVLVMNDIPANLRSLSDVRSVNRSLEKMNRWHTRPT